MGILNKLHSGDIDKVCYVGHICGTTKDEIRAILSNSCNYLGLASVDLYELSKDDLKGVLHVWSTKYIFITDYNIIV